MSYPDEQSHSDQDLVSDGDPDNRDIEQHDEFASAKGFMPLVVPGMGVPHPGSALASAEHIDNETGEVEAEDRAADDAAAEIRPPGLGR